MRIRTYIRPLPLPPARTGLGSSALQMALRELSAPLSLDEDGGESIALEAPGVALVRGGEADPSAAPRGTLYVTTQRLVWLPEGGAAGVQADYPAITMHAISQEGACIYMQLAPPVQVRTPRAAGAPPRVCACACA